MLNWDKFWARVQKQDDGCWIWTGYRDRDGYGVVTVDCIPRKTYRITYERYIGLIPDGCQIDHLCRVRACCNPDHLEAVTLAENLRRGRIARGVSAELRPHGTRVRYQNGGCRCTKCREGSREYSAELFRRKQANGTLIHDRRGYTLGCRCDECKADQRLASREYYISKVAKPAT